jgi:hypothetical protein
LPQFSSAAAAAGNPLILAVGDQRSCIASRIALAWLADHRLSCINVHYWLISGRPGKIAKVRSSPSPEIANVGSRAGCRRLVRTTRPLSWSVAQGQQIEEPEQTA